MPRPLLPPGRSQRVVHGVQRRPQAVLGAPFGDIANHKGTTEGKGAHCGGGGRAERGQAVQQNSMEQGETVLEEETPPARSRRVPALPAVIRGRAPPPAGRPGRCGLGAGGSERRRHAAAESTWAGANPRAFSLHLGEKSLTEDSGFQSQLRHRLGGFRDGQVGRGLSRLLHIL